LGYSEIATYPPSHSLSKAQASKKLSQLTPQPCGKSLKQADAYVLTDVGERGHRPREPLSTFARAMMMIAVL